MRNKNYPYSRLRTNRKSAIQKAVAAAQRNPNYNPKDARYKSVKGVKLRKSEQWFWLFIQLAPLTLLALYALLRHVI